MQSPSPGIYRHFKGNYYRLLYVAKHSETLESYVIYKALYGDEEIWIRPADMWQELVSVNGEQVRRFTFIKEV